MNYLVIITALLIGFVSCEDNEQKGVVYQSPGDSDDGGVQIVVNYLTGQQNNYDALLKRIQILEAEVDDLKHRPSSVSNGEGCTCRPGPRGPVGPTGPVGPRGAPGAVGYSGATGRSGSTGATGWYGRTGATGRPGPNGYQGYAGATGRSGATGATGSSGPSGRTGATGARGR